MGQPGVALTFSKHNYALKIKDSISDSIKHTADHRKEFDIRCERLFLDNDI